MTKTIEKLSIVNEISHFISTIILFSRIWHEIKIQTILLEYEELFSTRTLWRFNMCGFGKVINVQGKKSHSMI